MVSGFSGYSNTKPDKAELSLEIKFDDTKGKTIQWRDEDRQTRWRQTNEMKTDKRDEDRQTRWRQTNEMKIKKKFMLDFIFEKKSNKSIM
jgi:hypothetical protein